MKKTLFFLLVFGGLFFWVFPNSLRVEATEKFFVFDARPYFFNRWCYSVGSCLLGSPPPGKTFGQMVDDFDALAFLVSAQGLVNREKKQLLLLGSENDEKWISQLTETGLWQENLMREDLVNLEAVTSVLKSAATIKGSVVWEAERPYTLNLAFTVAGADDLVVVRKGSSFYSKLTADFPVRVDLTALDFNNKDAGYRWLVDNYLNKGKLAPVLYLM